MESKGVNDILYEGLFNDRPCIVKCSRIAPWSIGNEYRLLRKLWMTDPMVVVEPLAYHEGPMAFVVEEKLPGPTLTDLVSDNSMTSEQSDSLAMDLERIAIALQESGIVHRDLNKSDNFILGNDMHLRIIDCQFSVDRQMGCQDRWLLMRPKYHFAVFSGILSGRACLWNDVTSCVYQLTLLRQTKQILATIEKLKAQENKSVFRHALSWYDRVVLSLYLWSLMGQHFFAVNAQKRSRINYRMKKIVRGKGV